MNLTYLFCKPLAGNGMKKREQELIPKKGHAADLSWSNHVQCATLY